ncbi:MAG: ISNCY family transposase, partial [Deltaproteobacteria bacterium]|nr:ISNCY family transposase [Deltaproteobacteria bacterium]
KDQYGFILYHRVMQNEADVDITVAMVEATLERFSDFNSCSFDKGFHSPKNQEELAAILDRVILPRKGKLSAINKAIEESEEFVRARRKHSAVESSINALENHGLDRCRDHGVDGFKRYVALAVVARNLQIVGHILQQKEVERLNRLKKREQRKLRAVA